MKRRDISYLLEKEWWWGCDDKSRKQYHPRRYADVFRKQFPKLDAVGKSTADEDERFMRDIFNGQFKESSWFYEGYRRIFVPDLPRYCDLTLDELEEMARHRPCISHSISSYAPEIEKPSDGFTRYLVASYNLKMNDEALVRDFKTFLKTERKRLTIPQPAANKDVRRRPRAWTPWQTWDRIHVLGEGVSESEKKTLNKAEFVVLSELLLAE